MAFGFNPAQFQQATALDPAAAGGLPVPQNLPAVIPQQAQPQPAPQAAAQQGGVPAPPTWGKRGWLGDLLDDVFLNGAIQHMRTDEYNRGMADYNVGMQRQMMSQGIGGLFGGEEAPQASSGAARPLQASGALPVNLGLPAPRFTGFDIGNPRTQKAITALAFVNPKLADTLVQMGRFSRPEIAVGTDGRAYNKYDPTVIGSRFAKPEAVNNTIVDTNSPDNVNRVIPSPPVAGAKPVYDNRGNVVDWTLPPGALGALEQHHLATGGKEAARHNIAEEAVAATTANTGQGRLGLEQTNSGNFAPPPGFVIRRPK